MYNAAIGKHLARVSDEQHGLALGCPVEYLNPVADVEGARLFSLITGYPSMQETIRRTGAVNLSAYLRYVFDRTARGLCGIKGDFYQLGLLMRYGLFFSKSTRWRYIYLTRRDL